MGGRPPGRPRYPPSPLPVQSAPPECPQPALGSHPPGRNLGLPDGLLLQIRTWGGTAGIHLPRARPLPPLPSSLTQQEPSTSLSLCPRGVPHWPVRLLLSTAPRVLQGLRPGSRTVQAVHQQTRPHHQQPPPAKAPAMGGGSDSRSPAGAFSLQCAGLLTYLLPRGEAAGGCKTWGRWQGGQ